MCSIGIINKSKRYYFRFCCTSMNQGKENPIGVKKLSKLKKLGLAGILFFVIKGTVTTALIVLGSQGLMNGCN